jgi:tRNA-(ms[2]io[6]A)-hydroxylase
VPVGAPPVDTYAAELRRAAAEVPRDAGIKNGVLVDRLLVGALIEARSCERFQLLAQAAEGVDDELHALWRDLLAAEARHYRTFVDLAVRAAGDDRSRVVERLDRLAEAEAAIVTRIAADAAGVGPRGEVSRASIHG